MCYFRKGNFFLLFLLFIGFFFATGKPLNAETFYIDPATGSIDNDGSIDHPWTTLQEVVEANLIESRKPMAHPYKSGEPLVLKNEGAPVKPGDTLVLLNGYHGKIFISMYYNTDFITITAETGHNPRIAGIEIQSGSRWIVRGLTISPTFAPVFERETMVKFSSHSWRGPGSYCIVEDCTVYSIEDSSTWTEDDWNTLSCSGISLSGDDMTARNNYLKNVNFGITSSGDRALVEKNTIENFSGDGLRGLGDYSQFLYNIVKNCYDVNLNHDDGFQSWSLGDDGVGSGVVKGMVLRGNFFLNYTDPNQNFRGPLQGIGCFDGMFEDWIVENNVIIVDHYHGISLYGATNCRIINNTVVDINNEKPGPSWIMITKHKNDTLPSGCIVRNNIATNFTVHEGNTVFDHNLEIDYSDYSSYFIDFPGRDFHLVFESPAMDAGSSDSAPTIDLDKIFRPQNGLVDIGAYEYDLGEENPEADAENPETDEENPETDAENPDNTGTVTQSDGGGGGGCFIGALK